MPYELHLRSNWPAREKKKTQGVCGMVYVLVVTTAHQIFVFLLLLGTEECWTAQPSVMGVAPFCRVLANELRVEVTGHLNAEKRSLGFSFPHWLSIPAAFEEVAPLSAWVPE